MTEYDKVIVKLLGTIFRISNLSKAKKEYNDNHNNKITEHFNELQTTIILSNLVNDYFFDLPKSKIEILNDCLLDMGYNPMVTTGLLSMTNKYINITTNGDMFQEYTYDTKDEEETESILVHDSGVSYLVDPENNLLFGFDTPEYAQQLCGLGIMNYHNSKDYTYNHELPTIKENTEIFNKYIEIHEQQLIEIIDFYKTLKNYINEEEINELISKYNNQMKLTLES